MDDDDEKKCSNKRKMLKCMLQSNETFQINISASVFIVDKIEEYTAVVPCNVSLNKEYN